MKLNEKMRIVANWLADIDNDLLVSAENDEASMAVIANTLVKASAILIAGADEVQKIEPETTVTPEQLDEIAAVAQAFDESGDELLRKQASVLDELLMTLAAPKNAKYLAKEAENNKIDELKKKYKQTKERQDEMNKVSDSLKAIEKSPAYKAYRPLEAPLSTRVCPEHFCQMARVGENRYQCVLDKRIFDFETGYTLLSGNKVPGTSVSEQTKVMQNNQGALIFDTRQSKLGPID